MKISKNQKGFGLVEGLLIVIALTLVVGVGYYVYDRQSSKNEEPQTAGMVAEEKTEEVPEEETLPQLVDYGLDGIVIEKKADVEKLDDTSESFKMYVSSIVGDNAPGKNDCESYVYRIYKIFEDEFASVGVGSPCGGGYGAVWKNESGTWDAVLGYQDIPQCKEIDKYAIPGSILEKCLVEDSSSPGGFREVKNAN